MFLVLRNNMLLKTICKIETLDSLRSSAVNGWCVCALALFTHHIVYATVLAINLLVHELKIFRIKHRFEYLFSLKIFLYFIIK